METMKSAAESLGKSGGGGAALGAGMVLIPQIMTPQGPAQAPAAALVICPKCGSRVPATSKFCPECGTQLTPAAAVTMNCPNCGKSIPAGSKFCPECGKKVA